MTYADLLPLANHVWQSTVFAGAISVLTLALRKNRASVRYWLWLVASVKFLVPFSLLVSASSHLGRHAIMVTDTAQWSTVAGQITQISQPFRTSAALTHVAPPTSEPIPAVLFGIWLCGVLIGLVCWIRVCRRVRTVCVAAKPLDLALPIPALSSPTRIEPAVVGIVRPVLLMPDGIVDQLTPAQLKAVLAHELCHVRRRDNFTGAIHMLVETLFWFHPLVWWIRAGLIEERERACDEDVLMGSSNPEAYAEGILAVCKFYLSAPACVSGVTGADLKKRIAAIMANQVARNLSLGGRLLLAASAMAAIGGPAVVGLLSVQPGRSQVQTGAAPSEFEAASVKRNENGISRGPRGQTIEPTRLTWFNINMGQLIEAAYGVKHYQVSGPDWIVNVGSTDRYDVMATTGKPVSAGEIKRMLGPLLVDRFHLTLHRETRELPAFALVVGAKEPKLQPGDGGDPGWGRDSDGGWLHKNWSMTMLADWMSDLPSVKRPVIDHTGLQGTYSFHENLLNYPKPGDGSGTKAETAARVDAPDDSFFTTLQSTLGLKLQSQKAQIEILVIDHAEKVPTEN